MTPEWLLSEKLQRRLLKRLGLRTTAPNANGWTTLERLPPKPMFPHDRFERTKKDNAAEAEQKPTAEMLAKRPGMTEGQVLAQAGKTITEVERAKAKAHILGRVKRMGYGRD